MNTKKITTISFLITLLLSFISCNTNDDIIEDDVKGKVTVIKMTDLRKSNIKRNSNSHLDYSENKDPYHIQYKNIILDNVYLTTEEANKLRAAASLDTITLTLTGYTEYTRRITSRPEKYARSYSPKDPAVIRCGIQPGTYMTRDVWFIKEYKLPYSLAVVLPESGNNYSDHLHIGWMPAGEDEDTENGVLGKPGYSWSLTSDYTLSLKTGAYLSTYTTTGQELFYTYPFKTSDLVWQVKLLVVN